MKETIRGRVPPNMITSGRSPCREPRKEEAQKPGVSCRVVTQKEKPFTDQTFGQSSGWVDHWSGVTGQWDYNLISCEIRKLDQLTELRFMGAQRRDRSGWWRSAPESREGSLQKLRFPYVYFAKTIFFSGLFLVRGFGDLHFATWGFFLVLVGKQPRLGSILADLTHFGMRQQLCTTCTNDSRNDH